jgi:steroid 5-alpha reductase family enzyme
LSGESDSSILALDIIAFIIGIGAATIQLISDGQMRNFIKKKKANETNQAFYADGLWAWSRHPNYFGEVAMWFSLWLFAMSHSLSNWWMGIGWVAMLALFLFISCPWMDRRSAAKREGYSEYMKHSNLFFMTPPRKK